MRSEKFALVCIPKHVCFDSLHLSRNASNGRIEFDWAPLREIQSANKGLIFQNDDEVADLIVVWYANLRLGGYRHVIGEELVRDFGTNSACSMENIHGGSGTVH